MYTLDDLFAKDIYSDELMRDNGNYRAAYMSLEEIKSGLREKMTAEEAEKIEMISECVREMEFQRGKAMFAAGFSLGKKYAEEIRKNNRGDL